MRLASAICTAVVIRRAEALEKFYKDADGDFLVLNKWFGIQVRGDRVVLGYHVVRLHSVAHVCFGFVFGLCVPSGWCSFFCFYFACADVALKLILSCDFLCVYRVCLFCVVLIHEVYIFGACLTGK